MKIGIFYDLRMPYEGERPDFFKMMEEGWFVHIHLDNLHQVLSDDFDCIVNLHGSCFPESLWMTLKEKLQNGCGMVNIGGGIPFSRPMYFKDDTWEEGRQQTAYHEELGIIYAHAVKKENFQALRINPDNPVLQGFEKCFSLQDSLGMVVQFTKYKDSPLDAGSSGPMDAAIQPLLLGILNDDRPTVAPVVMIENFKGEFEGGRWIFVNQDTDADFWENGGASLLQKLAEYAASGAWEIVIRPNYACYYPGEQPALLVQGQCYKGERKRAYIGIDVIKDNIEILHRHFILELSMEMSYQSFPLDICVEKGMYTFQASIDMDNEPVRRIKNGFWGYDQELLESGSMLTCGRDYFYKNGVPMPVVGMTYMQPDVHRKYLYLPNVYLWDADFCEMKHAGINMVRTGIWTAHRTVMFNDGIASEEILRTLDAMFHTASKYDMPLVFNFFAFAPEMWEGENPYLDQRSIKAQKRFISSIISRHAKTRRVMWDLINEPSVCNPKNLWHPWPNGDRYELKAWHKWLQQKHGNIGELRRKWNCTCLEAPDFEHVGLPEETELTDKKDFSEHRRGLKFHDYVLFTQDVFKDWVREMRKTIDAAGAAQLVTVGQDEALNSKRPSPMIYQEETDYTTNHSWWLMDDLYWDGIFSKSPDKLNLIQETGIMYVPDLDNRARRSEEELRNILERKYALAFAASNAGAVQWIWNTNVYMDSINEVNIGAKRADGTYKPEADVSYTFGEFFREIAWMLEERKEEEVAVIYPYSNDFSLRDYANEATKRLCRILAYDMGIPFKVFSEYDLRFRGDEKLILLPSARTLSQEAWEALLEKVKNGCCLLMTGVFSQDEYWRDVKARKSQLDMETVIMPVSREETLYVDGMVLRASFGQKKIAWVDKELCVGEDKAVLRCISYGNGKVLWSPLPLEMSDIDQSTAALYAWAAGIAGISGHIRWIAENKPGVLMKKLVFKHGTLFIFVSENGEDTDIHFKDASLEMVYRCKLPSGRIAMFMVDGDGRVLKSYRDIPVGEE